MKNTCRDVMTTHLPTLHPSQTLHEALELMQKHRCRYLCAVDDAGCFVGLFGALTLFKRLLPQSLSIKLGNEVSDLNFMRTSIEELQQNLDALEDLPVSECLITEDLPRVHADDAVMEALFLMYRYHLPAVVCAPESAQFLGLITLDALLDELTPNTSLRGLYAPE